VSAGKAGARHGVARIQHEPRMLRNHRIIDIVVIGDDEDGIGTLQ
jgi:hypothetical protein